jgi:tripartite-type tricarboxylate transporter receptor subunit TctC
MTSKARPHLISRRYILKAAALAGASGVVSTSAIRSAFAAYPDRPVKILVPQPAAGPTDIMARFMSAELSAALAGSFYIENRTGSGGTVGIGAVARSEPDGYTLMVVSSTFAVNPALFASVPYDPLADFSFIAELGVGPNCVVVDPKLGVTSMAELIALARSRPGELNYTSPGQGTNPHLAAEMLKARENIKMVHVPVVGGGPAMQAILSGTVPILFSGVPPAQPYIKSGQLRCIALNGPKRWHDLPDVPTWGELGYDGPSFETFQAFMAPAKTPPEVVQRLEAAATGILGRPEIRAKLLAMGYEATGTTGAALRARVAQEVPMWKKLVADAGMQPR